MLNPAPKGNDQQIAVTATEGAALIGLPEKIEFLNFLVDKTESIVLPDVQERLDGEGRYPRQESDQVQAEEDQPKELKRETSFFGAALRFAGAIVGFLVGGSAGAALGSIVGWATWSRSESGPTSSGVGARAEELSTYELMGFPISPHQFSVVGSAHVEQRSPVPTLTLFGMPASLHQIAVLMPHRETAGIAATRMTNAGLSSP